MKYLKLKLSNFIPRIFQEFEKFLDSSTLENPTCLALQPVTPIRWTL